MSNLRVPAGDRRTIDITVTGADLGVAGTTLAFTATAPGKTTIVKSTAAGTITVLTATQARMNLEPADTAGLDGATFSFKLVLTQPDGTVTTVDWGDLFIDP